MKTKKKKKAAVLSNSEEIEETLRQAQQSIGVHPQLVDALVGKYDDDEAGNLLKDFFPYLAVFLLEPKSAPHTDRLLAFFVSAFSRLSAVSQQALSALVPLTRSAKKCVRLKAVQLVSALLDTLDEEAEVDEQLFDALREALSERLLDKLAQVRAAAVSAVYRLQDPESPECAVLAALAALAVHDESAAVRAKAVEKLAVTKATLRLVAARVRDEDATVRKAALVTLRKKVQLKNLKIKTRVAVLAAGLGDREKEVSDAAVSLCANWLAECADASADQAVAFLAKLDLLTHTEESTPVLEGLVRHFPGLVLHALTGSDGFRTESAFLLRTAARLCSKEPTAFGKLNEFFAQLTLVQLVSAAEETLHKYRLFRAEKDAVGFLTTLGLLLETAGEHLDFFFFEETAMATTETFVSTLLGDERVEDTTVVVAATKLLSVLHARTNQPLERTTELLTSVFADGPVGAKELAVVRAVASCCFSDSASDGVVATEAYPQMPAQLLELFHNTVLPSIASENPFVRNAALQTLAPFLVQSAEFAARYSTLLLSVLENDQEALQLTVLKVLFDLALVHGATQPIDRLSEFLYSENPVLMATAAEGCCKLLLNGVLEDCRVFSSLAMLFFDPATADNDRLRQVCSLFFSLFVPFGEAVDEQTAETRREAVYTALLPCVKTVLGASAETELHTVDLERLCVFFLKMLASGHGGTCWHKKLFFDLLFELLAFRKVEETARLVALLLKLGQQNLFDDGERLTEAVDGLARLAKGLKSSLVNRKTLNEVEQLKQKFESITVAALE